MSPEERLEAYCRKAYDGAEEELEQGFNRGKRNNSLFKFACKCIRIDNRANIPTGWIETVEEFAKRGEMKSSEARGIVNSAQRTVGEEELGIPRDLEDALRGVSLRRIAPKTRMKRPAVKYAGVPEKSPAVESAKIVSVCRELIGIDFDPNLKNWLKTERGIDPDKVKEHKLAVTVPPDLHRPWMSGGPDAWRLAIPLYDHTGSEVSMVGRRISKAEDFSKSMSVKGGPRKANTAFMNPAARSALRDGTTPHHRRLCIVEGEMDYLAAATTCPGHAFIGIQAGSFKEKLAEAIAKTGLDVIISTHSDKSGEGYAEKIRKHLPAGTMVGRNAPPKDKDLNDILVESGLDALTTLLRKNVDTEPNRKKEDPWERSLASNLVEEAFKETLSRGQKEMAPVPVGERLNGFAKQLGGGLWAGLHVLVGNPKSGKSTLALQIAKAASFEGHPVAYVALELGPSQIIRRFAAMEMRQSGKSKSRHWSQYELGEIEDTPRLTSEFEHVRVKLKEKPLHVFSGDANGWSADSLEEIGKGLVERCPAPNKTPLVVVDYLQLMTGKERDLRERIKVASYQARMLARELNIAVLAISSTARDKYEVLYNQTEDQREKPYLLMGLGKESGEIEYAADSVTVISHGSSPELRYLNFAARRAKPKNSKPYVEAEFDGTLFEVTDVIP